MLCFPSPLRGNSVATAIAVASIPRSVVSLHLALRHHQERPWPRVASTHCSTDPVDAQSPAAPPSFPLVPAVHVHRGARCESEGCFHVLPCVTADLPEDAGRSGHWANVSARLAHLLRPASNTLCMATDNRRRHWEPAAVCFPDAARWLHRNAQASAGPVGFADSDETGGAVCRTASTAVPPQLR